MRSLKIGLVTGVILCGAFLFWQNIGSLSSKNSQVQVHAPSVEPKQEETEIAALPMQNQNQAFYDPLVIAPCNLVPVSEQDVSSQVDGVFDTILVELGQRVDKGELLGQLDDRQLKAQVESLRIRASSSASEQIAKAQFDEAESKVQYALKANESGLTTVPELESKTYQYQRERYAQEIQKAREDRESACKELDRAMVVLGQHEIRSALGGEVIKVYKRNGESVKQAEPLFRIANCNSLRIEGLCKVQQANLIRIGMRALVEPEQRGEQLTEFVGHTGSINALAVSSDGRLIASASEDRNVILWRWPGGERLGSLLHPAEVTAIAFGSGGSLVTGCADGQVRLWRQIQSKNPIVTALSQAHEGCIRALAIFRQGNLCATGGDDNRIGIWDLATGTHRKWLQQEEGLSAHQGAVTSLQFTPTGELISAGRDNNIKVWSLEGDSKLISVYPGRTGEVANLGISPDGRSVLFDMGEELRILDRERGTRLGSLQNLKQGRFQSFAQFSPSGKLLATIASNSRLQFWRVPATPEEANFFRQGYSNGFHRSSLLPLGRFGSDAWLAVLTQGMILTGPAPKLWQVSGQEVRYFLAPSGATVLCGVFAPDESVVFTGGIDKTVHVWAVPPARLWRQTFEARITYVGSQVERGTDMVRVRAEMENPPDSERRLRAGLFANMRVFPETASMP